MHIASKLKISNLYFKVRSSSSLNLQTWVITIGKQEFVHQTTRQTSRSTRVVVNRAYSLEISVIEKLLMLIQTLNLMKMLLVDKFTHRIIRKSCCMIIKQERKIVDVIFCCNFFYFYFIKFLKKNKNLFNLDIKPQQYLISFFLFSFHTQI